MFGKFAVFNRRLSGCFEYIGVAALMLMMAVTCIDVVGAKVFSWRLFGAIDIVMLSQSVAISFAAGMALIFGRHIQVEFFIALLPKPVQAIIDSLIFLLGFGLFGLIIWRLFALAIKFQATGEYSATASIPYHPFAYGIALAMIPVCLVLLHGFLTSIRGVIQK